MYLVSEQNHGSKIWATLKLNYQSWNWNSNSVWMEVNAMSRQVGGDKTSRAGHGGAMERVIFCLASCSWRVSGGLIEVKKRVIGQKYPLRWKKDNCIVEENRDRDKDRVYCQCRSKERKWNRHEKKEKAATPLIIRSLSLSFHSPTRARTQTS